MLMGHPSVQEARAFKSSLYLFAKASGLAVNAEKYQVFFFNTPIVTQRNIGRISGFPKGTMPSKYLGIPLGQGTIWKVSWKYLLDRIKTRLENWTLKPMNLPSRLVLVKSVLQAILVYLFSVLSAPKSILQEIWSIQRNLLWAGRESKAKFLLVSWEQVCSPTLEEISTQNGPPKEN